MAQLNTEVPNEEPPAPGVMDHQSLATDLSVGVGADPVAITTVGESTSAVTAKGLHLEVQLAPSAESRSGFSIAELAEPVLATVAADGEEFALGVVGQLRSEHLVEKRLDPSAPDLGHSVVLDDVLTDVDAEVALYESGVKVTYEHLDEESLLRPFQEWVSLPPGWSAVETRHGIELLDLVGTPQFVWRGGPVRDAAGSTSTASLALVGMNGDRVVADVIVDHVWAQESERSYPVYVDPELAQVGGVLSEAERSTLGVHAHFAYENGVNVATGNWTFGRTDIDIAGPGIPLVLALEYNSRSTALGSFGRGFTTAFDWRLFGPHPGGSITVAYPDGSTHPFFPVETFGSGQVYQSDVRREIVSIDGDTRIISWPDGSSGNFDAFGNLISFNGRVGPAISLEYSWDGSNRRLDSMSHVVSGNQIDFEWESGRIVKATTASPVGTGTVSWSYEYDLSNERLVAVCDGRSTAATQFCERYGWAGDRINRVFNVSSSDGDSAVREIAYRPSGRVESVTERPSAVAGSAEYVTQFSEIPGIFGAGGLFHPGLGTVSATVTTPLGDVIAYEFDNRARVVVVDLPDDPTILAAEGVHRYEYNGRNQRTKTISPSGETRSLFDSAGRLEQEIDRNGHSTWFKYNEDGRIDRECPHLSAGARESPYCTTYEYDSLGHLETRSTNLGGSRNVSESFDYDQHGQLLSSTDGAGRVTTHTYATANTGAARTGDLLSIEWPSGLSERYSYNSWGQRKSTQQRDRSAGAMTTAQYTRWTTVETIAYNKLGLPTITRGPTAHNIVTGDPSRLVHRVDYNADAQAFRIAEWDQYGPGNSSWLYRRYLTQDFDRLGRPITTYGPRQILESGIGVFPKRTADYDWDGNLVEACDARSICTTYENNSRGLLVSTTRAGVTLVQNQYWDSGLLRRQRNAEGHFTLYNYDNNGNLTRTRMARSGGPVQWFEVEAMSYRPGTSLVEVHALAGNKVVTSRLAQASYGGDPNRTLITNGYTNNGLVRETTVQHSGTDRLETYFHALDGQVEEHAIAEGQDSTVTRFEFDAGGFVDAHVIDPDGLAIRTEYLNGGTGQPLTSTDPRGAVTDLRYSQRGDLVETVLPEVEVAGSDGLVRPVLRSGYDVWGNPIEVVDAAGNVTTTTYDFSDRPLRTTLPDYQSPATGSAISATLRNLYDLEGNLLASIDAAQQRTDFEYDEFNRLRFEHQPPLSSGRQVRTYEYAYDRVGNLKKVVAPDGARTDFAYNERNHQESITQHVRATTRSNGLSEPAAAYTTLTARDVRGNGISVTDPDGDTTVYDYDGFDRLVAATDPDGDQTSWVYNHLDLVLLEERPGPQITETRYDAAGRAREVEHRGAQTPNTAVSTSQTYNVDSNGNVTLMTTRGGTVTSYDYDSHNRLSSVSLVGTDVANLYEYDVRGLLASFTDGRGPSSTVSQSYNVWGLLETRTEPATLTYPALSDRQWEFSYDERGNLHNLAEPGNSVVHLYDAAGNLTSVVAADGTSKAFVYDDNNRLAATGSSGGQQTLLYDDRDALIETSGVAGSSFFTHHPDGRLATRTDPSSPTAHVFTWTADGRLDTHDDPVLGELVDYDWLPNGNLSSVSAGQLIRQFGYAPSGQRQTDFTRRILSNGTLRTQGLVRYWYDDDGNVRRERRYQQDVPESQTDSHFYFDAANRLQRHEVRANFPGCGFATIEDTSYGYDPAGNRLSAVVTSADVDRASCTSHSQVESNQWDVDARNMVQISPDGNHDWSSRGTLRSTTDGGQTTTYDFDGLGHLQAVNTPIGSATYVYDAHDRLVERTSGIETTPLTYAGMHADPAVDGQTRYGRTAHGALSSLASASLAPQLAITDLFGDLHLVAPVQGDRATTNYRWTPYGELEASKNDTPEIRLGFQSDFTDPLTGHVKTASRWYAPAHGSFLSRDIYDGLTDSALSLNRFAFSLNNPVGYRDFTGLCAAVLSAGNQDFSANIIAVEMAVTICGDPENGVTLVTYASQKDIAIQKERFTDAEMGNSLHARGNDSVCAANLIEKQGSCAAQEADKVVNSWFTAQGGPLGAPGTFGGLFSETNDATRDHVWLAAQQFANGLSTGAIEQIEGTPCFTLHGKTQGPCNPGAEDWAWFEAVGQTVVFDWSCNSVGACGTEIVMAVGCKPKAVCSGAGQAARFVGTPVVKFLKSAGESAISGVGSGVRRLFRRSAPSSLLDDFADVGSGANLIRRVDVDGVPVDIKSGHGYRADHGSVDITGVLGRDAVDSAVATDLASRVNAGTSVTRAGSGHSTFQTVVGGHTVEYRAVFVPATGRYAVGTYYIP